MRPLTPFLLPERWDRRGRLGPDNLAEADAEGTGCWGQTDRRADCSLAVAADRGLGSHGDLGEGVGHSSRCGLVDSRCRRHHIGHLTGRAESRRFAVDQTNLRGVVGRIPETSRRIGVPAADTLAGDSLEIGHSQVEEDNRRRIEEDTDCMDRTWLGSRRGLYRPWTRGFGRLQVVSVLIYLILRM